MIMEIGIISGEILTLLEDMGKPMSLEEIKFHIDEPIEIIDMSVGWLVRESYIVLEPFPHGYMIKEHLETRDDAEEMYHAGHGAAERRYDSEG